MNEAIYPFYLLQQPAIVIVGYFVIQWNLPIIFKILLLLLLSFGLAISIYWFLIRPFNILRVIFGLKPRKNKHTYIWVPNRNKSIWKILSGVNSVKNKPVGDK